MNWDKEEEMRVKFREVVVPQVAELLGATLADVPEDNENWWYRNLVMPDGVRFSLMYRSDGRITADGNWPRDNNGKSHMPISNDRSHIGMSVEKAPEKIARDIEKRFLPEYIPVYWKMVASAKDANDSDDAVLKFWKDLGITPQSWDKYSTTWCKNDSYVRLKYYGSGKVRVECDITPDNVKKLLTILEKEK